MNYRLGRLLAVALASMAAPALAQDSASAPGTATVVDQFAVTKDTDLLFGTIVLPSSGSNNVVISEIDGARTLTGAGNAAFVGGGNGRATFTVEGDGGAGFSIDVPANFLLERNGGAETILVALTGSAASGTTSGSPGNPGSASFGVGGSLPIGTTTVAGFYEGSFVVTVDSN